MKNLLESFKVWKLALLKVALVAFVAGAGTFGTAMSGVDWENLRSTEKLLVLLGVGVTVCNTIIAFLDRTISRIHGENGGAATGATEFLKKL